MNPYGYYYENSYQQLPYHYMTDCVQKWMTEIGAKVPLWYFLERHVILRRDPCHLSVKWQKDKWTDYKSITHEEDKRGDSEERRLSGEFLLSLKDIVHRWQKENRLTTKRDEPSIKNSPSLVPTLQQTREVTTVLSPRSWNNYQNRVYVDFWR